MKSGALNGGDIMKKFVAGMATVLVIQGIIVAVEIAKRIEVNK